MKRFLVTALFLLFIVFNAKALVTWDGGGGDNLWNTAANWSGNIVPTASDNVLLDNSVVTGTYSVILPGGAVTIFLNSLTITPSGTNNITLTLPAANTNNPGLSITGTGDALVLNIGAILKNSSGASAGTGVSIANTFRINNGGHYIHNTGRANAGISSQLSAVAGTETGEFEFDDPTGSTILSLSGKTYGSLTLSAISNGTASYIGSGASPVTINGNLKINTGVSLAISMSANFIVHGNYTQASSSTFNLQSSTNNNLVRVMGDITSGGTITKSGTGLPTIELNGIANQNINIASITNNVTVNINNAAGATLQAPLLLPYKLQLTSGKIKTDAANLLTLPDNATYTGGSSTSFVEGPMKKIGDEDFTFPVGAGNMYTPIGITGGTGAAITDQFTAEYKRTNPQGVFGTAYAAGINHISYVEYWQLDRNAGIASKIVSLKVNTTSFCYKLANTFISKFDGSQWTNEVSTNGGITSVPPYETGTITTSAAISSFSPFTIATDLAFNANPLPVKLISFTAKKTSSGTALLNWELAECCSATESFEVEKSTNNSSFVSVVKISGSPVNRFYTIEDNQLPKGITYYRLKITEANGIITYSKTIVIVNEQAELLITSLSPNPVRAEATLTISSVRADQLHLAIHDLSGKTIKQWKVAITAGNNNLPVNTDGLPAGIYHIVAAGNSSPVFYLFVKQ